MTTLSKIIKIILLSIIIITCASQVTANIYYMLRSNIAVTIQQELQKPQDKPIVIEIKITKDGVPQTSQYRKAVVRPTRGENRPLLRLVSSPVRLLGKFINPVFSIEETECGYNIERLTVKEKHAII
jgi:hypothetical protein